MAGEERAANPFICAQNIFLNISLLLLFPAINELFNDVKKKKKQTLC